MYLCYIFIITCIDQGLPGSEWAIRCDYAVSISLCYLIEQMYVFIYDHLMNKIYIMFEEMKPN